MEILLAILFVICMFFGWAMGGESPFGKGKRGLLLSIPMILFFLASVPFFPYLMMTPLALYIIYQLLFYDMGIEMVYDQHKWYGWLIIGLNGAIIGLTPIMLAAATANYIGLISSVVAGILGFCGVVWLSNSPVTKGIRDWMSVNLPWKFKDAWFVCEGLMGAILGVVIKLFW